MIHTLSLGAIALFVFQPAAAGFRQLALFGALALVPAAGFMIYAQQTGDSIEQGYARAFAAMAALPAAAGTASRAVSLLAARRGHTRPASLWIEGTGMILTMLAFGGLNGMAG